MIKHERVTYIDAEILGYPDNFLSAEIEGHDITEYNSGSAIAYWVITEYEANYANIMVMNINEATEYVRNKINK